MKAIQADIVARRVLPIVLPIVSFSNCIAIELPGELVFKGICLQIE
jgi:hypothetical protein